MQTKSNIQIVLEKLDQKARFSDGLKSLMENYDIRGNVLVPGNYDVPIEPTRGYFDALKSFGTVQETLKAMTEPTSQGIYIRENKEFVLGNIKESIDQCKGKMYIIDLGTYSIYSSCNA